MISASVEIADYLISSSDADDIKEFVYTKLAHQLGITLTADIRKNMIIKETVNPNNNSRTYTGSINASVYSASVSSSPNTITISAASNGISGSMLPYSPVQKNLRVVEYTKSGKVTRVELQFYDETTDDWIKIPRIQLEE